ncbi:hypothetical protein SRABI106_03147 [Rahnella aquatilis]|nr:hypothetical protein SRABI106_03147 [Rahnella aquatilis]
MRTTAQRVQHACRQTYRPVAGQRIDGRVIGNAVHINGQFNVLVVAGDAGITGNHVHISRFRDIQIAVAKWRVDNRHRPGQM